MEGDLHAEGPRPSGRCQADAAKPHHPEVMAGSERRTGAGPMVIGSPAEEPMFRLSFKSIQLMVMWFTVCCRAICSFSVTLVIKRQCYEYEFESYR